jgi:hypothetical protein
MNIVLVPYTWTRHFAVALFTGSAALLAWWVMLFGTVHIRPILGIWFTHGAEGAFLLAFAAGAIAASSLAAESALRRMELWYAVPSIGAAGFFAFFFTLLTYTILSALVALVTPTSLEDLIADSSFASFRFKFLQWGFAGAASGIAPFFVRVALWRKWLIGWDHWGGGIASAAIGAAVWHGLAYFGLKVPGTDPVIWLVAPDMYLAPAMGLFTWGFLHGLLVWGIPDELYAGWFRILRGPRPGHRIPIDRVAGGPAERFVGHFPRGLDMNFPAEAGVAELHVSFVTDGKHRYAVRGLSQQPTLVHRFLERVDLRYDARRPAPLETELSSEDRIYLGDKQQTVVEFLLLPKDEF